MSNATYCPKNKKETAPNFVYKAQTAIYREEYDFEFHGHSKHIYEPGRSSPGGMRVSGKYKNS